MKVNIQSIHFSAREDLKELIQNSLDKLENYWDLISEADVILKVEKDSSKENKIVEIKIDAPKAALFAADKSASFEIALDSVVSKLKKQISKQKEKLYAH